MSCKKIFINQTAIRLILDTEVRFANNPIVGGQIEIIDPQGIKITWNAQALPGTDSSIYIDFDSTHKFVTSGDHKVRALLLFEDGRVGIGEWVTVKVYY